MLQNHLQNEDVEPIFKSVDKSLYWVEFDCIEKSLLLHNLSFVYFVVQTFLDFLFLNVTIIRIIVKS